MLRQYLYQLLSLILFMWTMMQTSFASQVLENEIHAIVDALSDQRGEILRPFLKEAEIHDFITRTRNFNLFVLEEGSRSLFRAEPNSNFLGSVAQERYDEIEYLDGHLDETNFNLSERRWDQLTNPAAREAIILHTILFNMKLEKNGDFHITRAFFEKRKRFWDLHQSHFKQCECEVIESGASQGAFEKGEINPHQKVLLTPSGAETISLEFQEQNGFRGQLVILSLRKDKAPVQLTLWQVSPYDLLGGNSPSFDFSLSKNKILHTTCNYLNL